MLNKKVKTRFAPSPTGYLHIGGLRSALFSYLFAKQYNGKFILRIEDTDRSRYVEGAELQIINSLQKMGLNWDEGPYLINDTKFKEKGQNGPYFQSKRLKIYKEYLKKLISSKKAYYCFCTEERLEKLRAEQQSQKQPTKYDNKCRNLTESEVNRKLINNEKYVVRLKVPDKGEIKFNDIIRSQVSFQVEDVDDQILIKSDGYPTYHLAVVIDDHLMGITHVIRGEEWISSTPKHILIYQAFGWEIPKFAHLPLLLNKDRSKLSKRQGDVAIEDYLDKGYLAQSIINYVALLGWHPKDDREIFRLKELIKNFDLKRVQKAGAIFDLEKLNWFNSYYIKNMSEKEIIKAAVNSLPQIDEKLLIKILKLEKGRLNTLNQIEEICHVFLEVKEYNKEMLIFKKSTKEDTLKSLMLVKEKLINFKKFKKDKLFILFNQIVKDNNLKNGDLFWPLRVSLSGQEMSPPPEEILEIIGKEESLKRINNAINKLK